MNLRAETKQELQIIPDLIKSRAKLILQKKSSETEISNVNNKILAELNVRLLKVSSDLKMGFKLRIAEDQTFLEFKIHNVMFPMYNLIDVAIPFKPLRYLKTNEDITQYIRDIKHTLKRINFMSDKSYSVVKSEMFPGCYFDLTNRYCDI